MREALEVPQNQNTEVVFPPLIQEISVERVWVLKLDSHRFKSQLQSYKLVD